MTESATLAIRRGTADDWPGIVRLMKTVFHATQNGDAEDDRRTTYEPDRSLVADDDGEVVGHICVLTRDLAVPGGLLPAAHITMAGVKPTYRRRGLLTHLMLQVMAEAPEPIAVGWPTVARIYPRFGYALATQRLGLTVDPRDVRLPEPAAPGSLHLMTVDQARPVLRQVYESILPTRPGWSSRDERWWDRLLADPPGRRRGASERRVTVHEGSGGFDGYALWRAKVDWGPTGARGEARIEELVASDVDAYLALWRFLLTMDLAGPVSAWAASVDEPLTHLADEPRQVSTTLSTGLYLGILDLPGALTSRRYTTPLDLVIEVTDPVNERNTGRWRLTADGEKVTCASTEEPADLACAINEIAAAYLGGISLSTLAAAGRVRELRPGTLAVASIAFGWHRAPSAIEFF
jgi:predicted acetyltransferase